MCRRHPVLLAENDCEVQSYCQKRLPRDIPVDKKRGSARKELIRFSMVTFQIGVKGP
jgi:hypothetical protein